MSQLRQAEARFTSLQTQVVVIGMGNPSETQHFKKQLAINFPFLSDTGAASYTPARMGQIRASEELKPKSLGAFFKQIFKGNFGGKPIGKVRQLGGAIVVDTEGQVLYAYRSRSMSDNAPIRDLLANLKR